MLKLSTGTCKGRQNIKLFFHHMHSTELKLMVAIYSTKTYIHVHTVDAKHSNNNTEAHIGSQIHIYSMLDETSDNMNSTMSTRHVQRWL